MSTSTSMPRGSALRAGMVVATSSSHEPTACTPGSDRTPTAPPDREAALDTMIRRDGAVRMAGGRDPRLLGQFVYVRCPEDGRIWSIGQQPIPRAVDEYQVHRSFGIRRPVPRGLSRRGCPQRSVGPLRPTVLAQHHGRLRSTFLSAPAARLCSRDDESEPDCSSGPSCKPSSTEEPAASHTMTEVQSVSQVLSPVGAPASRVPVWRTIRFR